MFETINNIDISVLNFIQEYLSPEILKPTMKFFAHKESIFYAAIPLVPLGLYKNWKKTVFFLLILGVTIGFTDQTAYHLKKNIHRVRPSQAHLPEYGQTQTNSFPSAHACNFTAATVLIFYFWPILRIPTFISAIFVIYGRVFLNKHYPTDVFTGIFIGLFYSLIVLRLVLPFLYQKWPKIKEFTLKAKSSPEVV